MKGKTMDAYNMTADELRQFVERIEHLEQEKKDISDQIKEVYSELKGRGYSAAAVKEIIRIRKKDAEKLAEEESILEVYRAALGMS